MKVLIENISPKSETKFSGRTEHNNIIIFDKTNNYNIGDFCLVKVKSAKSWTLFGDSV